MRQLGLLGHTHAMILETRPKTSNQGLFVHVLSLRWFPHECFLAYLKSIRSIRALSVGPGACICFLSSVIDPWCAPTNTVANALLTNTLCFVSTALFVLSFSFVVRPRSALFCTQARSVKIACGTPVPRPVMSGCWRRLR